MSVIGYSLNDSIVVSDRGLRKLPGRPLRAVPYEIFNVSLTNAAPYLITSGQP